MLIIFTAIGTWQINDPYSQISQTYFLAHKKVHQKISYLWGGGGVWWYVKRNRLARIDMP
jgi:hypothetical protein